MIQILLASFLAAAAIYAFGQRGRAPAVSFVMFIVAVAGVVLVLFPRLSTEAANMLGVGRGADLVMYVFAVIGFVLLGNLHLRMRAINEVTTELARTLAILTAVGPEKDR